MRVKSGFGAMKKAIVFVICLLVIVYATIAVLLLDFKFFTSSAAKADDWLILTYKNVDNDGNVIVDAEGSAIVHTQQVPLFVNPKTGLKETKAKKTRFAKANLFQNPGHEFDAWYIGGTRYTSNSWLPGGITETKLDVLPRWTAKLYQITFDPMGGSPVPARVMVRYGDTYGSVIAANSHITKPNSDFAGWWTTPTKPSDPNAEGEIFPWTKVTITQNTTLYAHWNAHDGGVTPTIYYVNFHGNGHTGGVMHSQFVNRGDSVTLNPNTFERTNFRFDGWATSRTGGVAYANGATIANVRRTWDLYAVWIPEYVDPTEWYTLTYDANGGNVGAPYAQTVPANTTIVLPTYHGTRGTQVFGGWNTCPWGTGPTYAANSNFPVHSTMVLYVKWNEGATTPDPTYWLSGSWAGESRGSGAYIDGEGEVTHGNSGYLTFNAGTGRHITNISRGTVINGTLGSSQMIGVWISNMTSNVNVVATVAMNAVTPDPTHNLSGQWSGTPGTGASISGGGQITHGYNGTLTFNAGTGRRITNISTGNVISGTLGTSQTIVVQVPNMTHSVVVTATIGATTVNLSGQWSGATGSGASITGGGAFAYETTGTITFNAGTNKRVTNISTGSVISGTLGVSQTITVAVQSMTSNVTVTATVADAFTYVTVSFDSTGGSAVSAKTVTVGQSYGTLGTPTRSGFSFDGWFTASSGGTQVFSTSTVTNSSNHTLYARWTQNVVNVTVSFDSTGGSSVSAKTVTVGSTYGTLGTPTRSGFSFNGWFTASSGGSQVTSSTTVTNSSNHTLYARWTQNVVTVTVSFDSAGGSAVSAKSVTVGSQYGTLGTPTRSGFSFNGWFTASSGGSQVTATTTVTNSSNHTLHARWTQNVVTVTVSFNSAGGSSVSAKSVTVGQQYGTLGTPTRAGFSFNGWFTASSGGSQVTATTTVSNSANHTLFAQWTQTPPASISVTVSFNTAGGSAVSAKSVTVGGQYGTLGTTTRTGFTFNGWWTASAGGTQVTASSTVTNSANHTLFAQWTQNVVTVTVSFNTAGGSAVSAKNVNVGSQYGTLGTPTRSGFSFDGWWTASSGGSQVTATTTVTNSASHTLYARWTQNVVTVTVSFNAAGGSSVSAKSVTVGSTYGTLGTPTRAGFSFNGWFTASSGGSQVTSSTTVTNSSNHTLYARWTQNAPVAVVVTVSFNSAGGSAVSAKSVTVGSTYGTLGTPTRSGFSFAGWWTASSGGSQVTASSTVSTSTNHTLFARWTQNPVTPVTVTVSFNAAGGSAVSAKSVTVGSTYGTLGTPTRSGFSFAGWYTASSGGTLVTASTVVSTSTNHTLFARWA